jgi:hypothetical protein
VVEQNAQNIRTSSSGTKGRYQEPPSSETALLCLKKTLKQAAKLPKELNISEDNEIPLILKSRKRLEE